MAVNFGQPPTLVNLDDPNSVGNVAAPKGAPTINDTTFPANDPWGQFVEQQKGYEKQARINKLTADVKAAEDTAANPPGASIGDVVKGLPRAMWQIATNNPLDTAFNASYGMSKALLHIADAPVAIFNGLSHLMGSDFQMPLAGQTLMDWINSNLQTSDVGSALQSGGGTALDYELGGAAVRGLGVAGAATSRILGNVAGGQLNTPFDASPGDRAKQATFDAAFGVADTGARALATALKGGKAATEAISAAKNGVMNNAIATFEKADSPTYNPEAATQLRGFLESKAFDKPKNMVDFEKAIQKHLGDSFYDPKINGALQPIIDAAHDQFAESTGGKAALAADGPISAQDVLGDPNVLQAKAEANANRKPPQIKYEAKDSLGRDTAGNKKMATTVVDHKTGNAIISYDKSLDANPESKQTILDHEMGHVLDKRLNGGNNLSAELPNPEGNKANLQKVLGDFAQKNGKSVSETAAALQRDIETLGGEKGKANNEAFADAHAMYKMDPKGAAQMAPTFAKFMEYIPKEGQFSEHSTTLEGLKQDAPIAGKAVEDGLAKAKAEAKLKAATEKIDKNGPKAKLEPTSKPGKAAGGKIASTGLDTGERVKEKLSFNPDKINAPEDVEKLFSKMDAENASFSKQRMAKDNEQIRDLARLTGLKEEDLIKARPGSIANAETLTAARQLVMNKAAALADHLKSIDIPNASNAELKAIKDDYTRLVAMQQSVAGLRTEAANTLRSLQVDISPEENFTLKEAFQKLQAAGIASKGDAALFAGKIGADLQESMAGKITQGALKTWYAAILSGPTTPTRHFLGVMTNLLADIGSKAFNPATIGEVKPAITAFFKSTPEAFKIFKETWKNAEAKAGDFAEFSKVKQPIFPDKGFWGGYGKTVEVVGRTMEALASGYTHIAKEVEDASLSVNSSEMSVDLQKALARGYAESVNYFGEPKGFFGQKFLAGAKALTAGNYNPLKLIIPFTRIVSNILDRQFDYVPGFSHVRAFDIDHGLTRQTDILMKKYSLTSEVDRTAIFKRLKDQQIGRMVMGMGVSAGAFVAAKAGMVSGSGPSDYNAKIQLERTGWRPDSIKIGDHWVPYIWFGPLGGILSMAGNINDATLYNKNMSNDDYSAILGKGLGGWAQSQLHHSFLQGAADLLGAITDPTKASNYANKFISDIIPAPKAITGTVNIVRGVAADVTGDPTLDQQYINHNLIEKIRDNLGLEGSVGLGDPLEPQQNQFGEPLRADTIFGITPSFSHADAVDNYLQANDIVITIPNKNEKYSDGHGGKASLTPKQYTAYVKESGKQIYQNLQEMIPNLQNEDIDMQRSEIKNMIDEVRTATRANLN